LALGAQFRAAWHAPGADAGDRAAGLAGPALPAHQLGAGAANPCRTGHLRRILHPALALATDLLRSALVGVRAGLYGLRHDRPGVLVALATVAPARGRGPPALTREHVGRSFFVVSYWRGVADALHCACRHVRPEQNADHTEHRRGNTDPWQRRRPRPRRRQLRRRPPSRPPSRPPPRRSRKP